MGLHFRIGRFMGGTAHDGIELRNESSAVQHPPGACTKRKRPPWDIMNRRENPHVVAGKCAFVRSAGAGAESL
jgi:hypothetical protein